MEREVKGMSKREVQRDDLNSYLVVNDYFIEYVSEKLTNALQLIVANKNSLSLDEAKAVKGLTELRLFCSRVSITQARPYQMYKKFLQDSR